MDTSGSPVAKGEKYIGKGCGVSCGSFCLVFFFNLFILN